MPIKKHIVKVGPNNTIELPKSLCDALGVAEGMPIKLYSNKTGYQYILEAPLSFENLVWFEEIKKENAELRQIIKELKK